MITNVLWSQTTKKIFNGILIYAIAGILYSIFDPIDSLMNMGSGFMSMAMESQFSNDGPLSGVCTALLILIIVGYGLALSGLTAFRKILGVEDARAVSRVRTAFILAIIAAIVDTTFIPFVPAIINIIAFIFMISGYSALKKSFTFPEMARRGARTLFSSCVLLIIGAVLSLIPIAGDVLEGILGLIAYIMTFVGWKKIVNAAAELPQNENEQGTEIMGASKPLTPRFCSQCGMSILAGSKFCPKCGVPL